MLLIFVYKKEETERPVASRVDSCIIITLWCCCCCVFLQNMGRKSEKISKGVPNEAFVEDDGDGVREPQGPFPTPSIVKVNHLAWSTFY